MLLTWLKRMPVTIASWCSVPSAPRRAVGETSLTYMGTSPEESPAPSTHGCHLFQTHLSDQQKALPKWEGRREAVCCTPHPTKPLTPGWEPPAPREGAGMSLHSEPQTGKPFYLNTQIRAQSRDYVLGGVITGQRAFLKLALKPQCGVLYFHIYIPVTM